MPLRESVAALIAASALAGIAQPALADTLREALVAAYNTNPNLRAARAQQRATDETVVIDRAQGLPSINGTARHTEFVKRSSSSFTSPERIGNADIGLTVPLYAGGAIRNSVRASKRRVEAGQADLRGTESALFSQVVAAYMDVIRNEAVVELSANQVSVLGVNLQASEDRFEIGDLTRTDVAQSQSRLALSEGDLRGAKANLAAARETYIQLVGQEPGVLEAPPPLPGLPNSADSAVETALEHNPDLIAARERAQAARHDIEVAGAGRLPTVGLFANGGYTDYYGTLGGASSNVFSQSETTANAGVQISIPIFQGGLPAARERQAQARSSAALEQEIAAERNVIAQVRAAYSSWRAANAIIESTQTAVDAATLSLEGVRAENTVGNRTILDILDAQRELLSTQVQLVTAQRNAYVAGFSLLAAMGKAEARDLNLDTGGPLYDPEINYRRVRGKIFDWSFDDDPEAQSTRTIDSPAQDGEIQPSGNSGG